MTKLLSATAAVALFIAAGHANAQTDSPSSTTTAPAASTSSSMGSGSGNQDNGATAAQPSSDQPSSSQAAPHAKPRAMHSGEWSQNRKEAKVTDELNKQELTKVESGSSTVTGSSGAKPSSSNANGSASNAGSGSSAGITPSPTAGSDTVGKNSADGTPKSTGDRPNAPDSNSPEFNNGMTNAGQ